MEWSKIKNIVILILVCVNLALLGLVISRENRQVQFQEETWAGAVSALARNGIAFQAEEPPFETLLSPLAFTRDRAGEQQAAERLLGSLTERADSSSVRTIYTGSGGTAEFTLNGEFSVQFNSGVQTLDGRSCEEASLACLNQLGFHGYLLEQESRPSGQRLTFCQEWDGVPVFSCQAELVWSGETLRSLRGEYLAGSTASTETAERLTTADILVRFLAGLNQTGDMCSRIHAMESGYLLTGTRPIQLTPVWRIETDNGTYYVDAIDGSLSSASRSPVR